MEQSLGDMEEGQALTGSGEQKLYYQGRENDMLTGSLHVVDTTLQTAYESFESLLRQKDVFKGIHRKILDTASFLGISKNTLRYIERREGVNAVVLAAGILLTLLITLLAWYWWRR
uniref:Membrin-12 n=1 Tax=Lygus hesperus TaxID=30085 RepID=A0A0A9X2J5_LYGHE